MSRDAASLAVDIGGTKVAMRAVGPDGGDADLRFSWTRDPSDPPEAGRGEAERILEGARSVLAAVGATRPARAAVAFPGTLDPHGRVTRWPNRPHWAGLGLVDLLARHWRTSPLIHDDALLAAHAEATACQDRTGGFLYLGLGTGVGGAWLPPRGRAAGAAPDVAELRPCEPGHVIVRPDGAPCVCGRNGCLQAYASGPAFHRRTRSRGRVAALDTAARALALTLANVCELLPLTTVVLGGGVPAAEGDLVPAVRAALPRHLRAGTAAPHVLRARHGADGSLHGALLLARSDTPGQPAPAPGPLPDARTEKERHT